MGKHFARVRDGKVFCARLRQHQRQWEKRAGASRGAKRHVKSLRRAAIRIYKKFSGASDLPLPEEPRYPGPRGEEARAEDVKLVFLSETTGLSNHGRNWLGHAQKELKKLIGGTAARQSGFNLDIVAGANANHRNSMRIERRDGYVWTSGIYLDQFSAVIMPKLAADHVQRLIARGAVVMDNALVGFDARQPVLINAPEFPPLFHRQISLDRAHRKGLTGKGASIGVADSGIEPDHPDFRGRIASYMEFNFNGVPVSNAKPRDHHAYGHGTHVAGICAGARTGVAPGATLHIAAVLTRDGKNGLATGYLAQVLSGIEALSNLNLDIINISMVLQLNRPHHFEKLAKLLRRDQPTQLIIAAIGNEAVEHVEKNGYPARFSPVVAVGAVDDGDCRAAFSAWGQATVFAPDRAHFKPDLMAPGIQVLSCLPQGGYGLWTGTSMSAPQVAGAAALLIEADPTLRNDVGRLRNRLLELTVPLGQCDQNIAERIGRGRLDLARIDRADGASALRLDV